jgi:hypothetical protein
MTRERLIRLVDRIVGVDVATEAEHDALVDLLSVPRPGATDLIWHAERTTRRELRGRDECAGEESSIALAYKPIELLPAS